MIYNINNKLLLILMFHNKIIDTKLLIVDILEIKQLVCPKYANKFSEIIFNNSNIIMNMKTGYINVSKLCNDNQRNFFEWLEYNRDNNMLIDFYDKKTWLLGGCFHIIKDQDIDNKLINGIYIHPNLIVHIARWISPEISWNISEIINKINISK